MSRRSRSEARASMGGTLPNTAIISRSPSPSRPKLGRYAHYRDGLGRARAKIAETAQVWNIRPRANSTLDNDRITGRVPQLQVGKQVPAGRGKAIAATSKGGPPTAVAFGKGACHVRSPIRSSKFAVPIEEIRESERSRSLLRPSKSGRSGNQEPDLGCPPQRQQQAAVQGQFVPRFVETIAPPTIETNKGLAPWRPPLHGQSRAE